jgi:hypothetical protein
VYKKSFRPVVMFFSSMAAVWALFSAIGSFRILSFDRNRLPKLAPFAIALGVLHLITLGICIVGCAAAGTQRIPLVRAFAYGSIFAALAVVGAQFVEVVTHFMFKDDLITECAKQNEGDVVYFGWGIFGPSRTDTLDAAEAKRFCQRAWDHDSWSTIVALLILIGLSFLFVSTAFAYLHQTLDPSSIRTRTETTAYPLAYQSPYAAPPYDGSTVHLYAYPPPQQGGFAPPAGPPPGVQGYAPPAGPPPGRSSLPEYGYGAGAGQQPMSKDEKEDPFADSQHVPERDVTSRPAPGGPERFA